MCSSTLAALLGLATGCALGAPAHLLAPADPSLHTRYHAPPSPFAGLKRYEPVEARRDWGASPGAAPGESRAEGAAVQDPKSGMNGMSMPRMDMPMSGRNAGRSR